jgi:hypothetical protein
MLKHHADIKFSHFRVLNFKKISLKAQAFVFYTASRLNGDTA